MSVALHHHALAPPARALVVDDDGAVAKLFRTVLAGAGYVCDVAGGVAHALDLVEQSDPFDVAVLDLTMPDGTGLDLVTALGERSEGTAVLLVSGVSDREVAGSALRLGADGYLVKPVAPRQLLIAVDTALHQRDLVRRTREAAHLQASSLDEYVHDSLARLVRVAAMRDSETGHHSVRMSHLCAAIARSLALPATTVDLILVASRLHDIGKVAIPDEILHKPGPLTAAERRRMETHANIGATLLSGSGDELLDVAASIAGGHHERWDGTGYPHGLRAEAIAIEARIAAVADVFDALTSDRPYRSRFSLEEAKQNVADGSGTAFDPAVVDAFLRSGEVDVIARRTPLEWSVLDAGLLAG
jgi:putative two-component system response regulator